MEPNNPQIDRDFVVEYLSEANGADERQLVLQELSEHFGTDIETILQVASEEVELDSTKPSNGKGELLASADNKLGTLLEESWNTSGMTGREFCASLGISETSFYNYRKGTQVPMRKRMEQLCKRLEVAEGVFDDLVLSHQPKSIGTAEEELLLDLVAEGWSLSQIEETFQENGFDRNRASLGYHRNRLMDEFDLRPSKLHDPYEEDPSAATIKKILRIERRGKKKSKKNTVSEKVEKLQMGDVFQEYAHFIHTLGFEFKDMIPEYALTIIKDPNTGEVVHTTDIIDIVAGETAMEIKIGKYDPKEIKKQVLRQLRAIKKLQSRPDAHQNKSINAVKRIDVVVLEECEETDILRETFADNPEVGVRDIGFLVDYYTRNLNFANPSVGAMYEMIRSGRIKGDELQCVRHFLHTLNTSIDYDKMSKMTNADGKQLRKRMGKAFDELYKANRITEELVEQTLRDTVQIPRSIRKEHMSYMTCHYEEDGELKTTRRRFRRPEQQHMNVLMRLWAEAGMETPFECTLENLRIILQHQEEKEKEKHQTPKESATVKPHTFEEVQYAASEIWAERKTGHDSEIAREVGEFGSEYMEEIYRMMYATGLTKRYGQAFEIIKRKFTKPDKISDEGTRHMASNWKGNLEESSHMGMIRRLMYLIPNHRAMINIIKGIRAMQKLSEGDENTYGMELHELLDGISQQNDESCEHFKKYGEEFCNVSPEEMKYLLQKENSFRKSGIRCLSKSDQRKVTNMYMGSTSMDHRYSSSATSTTARRAAAISLINPELARTYMKMTIGRHKHGTIPPYHRLATMREKDPVYESIAGVYGQFGDEEIYEALMEMDNDINGVGDIVSGIYLQCPKLAKDFFRYAKAKERSKMDIIMALEESDYDHLPQISRKLANARDSELTQIEFGRPILGQLQ